MHNYSTALLVEQYTNTHLQVQDLAWEEAKNDISCFVCHEIPGKVIKKKTETYNGSYVLQKDSAGRDEKGILCVGGEKADEFRKIVTGVGTQNVG